MPSFRESLWLFTAAIAVALPAVAEAQAAQVSGDSIYREWQRIKSWQKTVGHSLPSVKTDSGYRRADYYLNGRRKMLSYTSRSDRVADSGYFICYDSLGRKTSEGLHDFEKLIGRSRFFYQGFLFLEGNYKYGDRTGLWRQYYTGSNILYSKGSYFLGGREGAFRTYHRNGRLKLLEYYSGGSLLPGATRFDSLGHPVKYTPLIIDPVYSGDINKRIDRIYREGRRRGDLSCEYTWFQFTIGRDGSISSLQTYSWGGTNNDYVKRLVSRMINWKPMMVDGHAIVSRADCKLCVWCTGARIEMRFSPLADITLLP